MDEYNGFLFTSFIYSPKIDGWIPKNLMINRNDGQISIQLELIVNQSLYGSCPIIVGWRAGIHFDNLEVGFCPAAS